MDRARLLAATAAILDSMRGLDVPRMAVVAGFSRAVAQAAATELAAARGMGRGLRRASLFRDNRGDGEEPSRAAARQLSTAGMQCEPVAALVRAEMSRGGEGARPAALLGGLHQVLLEHDLGRVGDGWGWSRWGGRRKRSGAFYTPASLVEPTVARTLEGLRGRRDWPRVCDPAMGTGVFLVACLDRLAGRQGGQRRGDGRAREVARRCLFGVDRDPLAVDLARIALWLEVGDGEWSADALDDQLRPGDSLVGAWSDRTGHYPLAAWHRAPVWRPLCDGVIRPELAARIAASVDVWAARDAEDAAQRADLWCAAWFWPDTHADDAPTPASWRTPRSATTATASSLARRHRFFHWELAFPAVFDSTRPGFDAVVGNPPWEIRKPSSREFFSRVDPGYRALGKQEAMGRQRQLFDADPGLERRWGRHLANHRALSHFLRHTTSPFGDPGAGGVTIALHRDARHSRALHDRWRGARGELPQRPFRLQGSADINCYKLFVEQSLALVREGGRLGLLLPSGLYTDRGASELRTELLDRCDWKWLFSFDNRDGLFPIHRSTRFGPVIAHKGGHTTAVQVAFQRRDAVDWQAENPPSLTYPRALIRRLSPGSGALLELRDDRDLAILRTQLRSCIPLGGPGGAAVDYHTGMHMTRDSDRFVRRDRAAADGFRQETYGHWLRGPWRRGGGPGVAADDRLALSVDGRWVLELARVEDVALPLAQGVGIGLLDGHAAVHVAGSGHRARWTAVPTPVAPLGPQFLVRTADLPSPRGVPGGARVALRSLSNATNERTVIATLLEDGPCGNSLAVLRVGEGGWVEQAAAAAVLASFCFDWAMRQRLAGTNVNAHFLWDSVWPRIDGVRSAALAALTLRLTHPGWRHAGRWLIARADLGAAGDLPPQHLFAQTPAARLRLRCMIDALVAEQFGLDESQLSWILRDCGHPRQRLSSAAFRRSLDPKGFWRVDRQLPAATRHTVLTLAALRDLARVGLEEFAGLDGRGGWQLPERSAGRAPDPGPRVDPAEGWSLCADHARRQARIRALAGLPGPA